MIIECLDSAEAVSHRAFELVCEHAETESAPVLGLPTGSTPLGLYRLLRRACAQGRASLASSFAFGLDEYFGIESSDPSSFRVYLEHELYNETDLDPSRCFVLPTRSDEPESTGRAYEERIAEAGGLSLALLGIGTNGHLAFNEPGSSFHSRTRVVPLQASTRRRAAPQFAGRRCPRRGFTLGLGSIMESRQIVLLAVGFAKAPAVAAALQGPVEESCPASVLQRHEECRVLVDPDAALGLRDLPTRDELR